MGEPRPAHCDYKLKRGDDVLVNGSFQTDAIPLSKKERRNVQNGYSPDLRSRFSERVKEVKMPFGDFGFHDLVEFSWKCDRDLTGVMNVHPDHALSKLNFETAKVGDSEQLRYIWAASRAPWSGSFFIVTE